MPSKFSKRPSKSYCRFRRKDNYCKKNVPASVCEQCGEYYVDTATASALESIVEEARKNKAEVLIVKYNELVA